MLSQNRRDFIKTTLALGIAAGGLVSEKIKAEPQKAHPEDRMGVLVDTTVCIGCRSCEYACKVSHSLPTEPLEKYHEDRSVFDIERRPSEEALTVVNEFSFTQQLPIDVKVQCMHCEEAACVASCIVHAFIKHKDGSVTWDTDKCIGCRYCVIACPFQVPVFQYSKAIQPDIMKCDFCYGRTSKGLLPACVEICPVEALTYGKREELLQVAKSRIKQKPDKYFDHIYGEYEVGGTSWLYLSGTDFSNLDFPRLGEDPAPATSESIQHGLFRYFVPPVALYTLLGGIMWITKRKENSEDEE